MPNHWITPEVDAMLLTVKEMIQSNLTLGLGHEVNISWSDCLRMLCEAFIEKQKILQNKGATQ